MALPWSEHPFTPLQNKLVLHKNLEMGKKKKKHGLEKEGESRQGTLLGAFVSAVHLGLQGAE